VPVSASQNMDFYCRLLHVKKS